MTTLTPTELTRYNRHFSLPEVGKEGQLKLKNAKILCVGAGGLGSPVLLYLAAAGIGTIGIIDDDCVALSNLQRQILFTESDINHKKVTAAKQHLLALNQHLNILTHDLRLTSQYAPALIQDYDLVMDCSDNFATRYIINDACFYARKPFVYASISQFEGQISTFIPENGPCYRCLFASPPAPELIPNCAEGGVLGVLPGILGCLQANEAIKLILGIGQTLVKRLLLVDALHLNFRKLNYQQDAQCILCAQHTPYEQLSFHEHDKYNKKESCVFMNEIVINKISVKAFKQLQESGADYELLDVREAFEYAICHLNGKLIPLGELPLRYHELDKNRHIIIHCKVGGRSHSAARFLMEKGFTQVSNLAGGTDAWREEIDSTLQQY